MQNAGGFSERDKWHKKARNYVAPRLQELGFVVMDHGAEFADGLSELVRSQDDRCSIMLRFRPDLVAVRPGDRAILCEVKGQPPKWDKHERRYRPWDGPRELNIEARSYRSLQEWNAGGNVAALAFCSFDEDGELRFAGAAWFDVLDEPAEVLVPRRWDFDDQIAAMGEMFPFSAITPTPYYGGGSMSGTPFIKLPVSKFAPLDEFTENSPAGCGAATTAV